MIDRIKVLFEDVPPPDQRRQRQPTPVSEVGRDGRRDD